MNNTTCMNKKKTKINLDGLPWYSFLLVHLLTVLYSQISQLPLQFGHHMDYSIDKTLPRTEEGALLQQFQASITKTIPFPLYERLPCKIIISIAYNSKLCRNYRYLSDSFSVNVYFWSII